MGFENKGFEYFDDVNKLLLDTLNLNNSIVYHQDMFNNLSSIFHNHDPNNAIPNHSDLKIAHRTAVSHIKCSGCAQLNMY